MIVTGVAAVLHQRMRNGAITLGTPSLLLLDATARITKDGQDAGAVTRAWVDDNLVHWEGYLNRREIRWNWREIRWSDEPPSIEVPLPEPIVEELVARGELVGAVSMCQGEMTTRAGGVEMSQWSIAGVSLLPYRARPWDGLHLTMA